MSLASKNREELIDEIYRLQNQIHDQKMNKQGIPSLKAEQDIDISQLHKGVESSGMVFYTADNGSTFIIKEAFEKWVEWEDGEFSKMINKPLDEVLPELCDAGLLKVLSQIFNSERPLHQIFELKSPGGQSEWKDFYFYKKSETEIMSFCFNVSNINNLIDDLHQSKAKYRALQKNVPIGLYQSTPTGQFAYVNEWAAQILGYHSTNDLMGLNINDLYAEPEKRWQLIEDLNQKGILNDVEVRVKKKDGSIIWLVFNARTVYDINNDVKHYDGYFYDITARKKAIDLLRESEKKYKSLYSFVALMSDTVPDLIWAKDMNRKYTFVNKGMCEKLLSAKDTNEPIGKEDMFFYKRQMEKFPNKPDWFTFGANCADSDALVMKTGKPQRFNDYGNVAGEFLYLDVYKAPLWNDAGEMIGIVGSAVDVTDRIKTEEELKLAKTKAEESDKLKTAFLANMSHEIRTPMNAIVGFSELLNDPDLTAETRKEFIKLINDNSKLLLNLIGDIIDVAKIEAEQIKAVRSTCRVNQIMDDLHGFFTKELQKDGNQKIEFYVTKAVEDDRFSIISDPLRFRQILNNLISNAIKFTDKGSIELGYIIPEDKKTIQFFVRDTGIGLSGEHIDIMFERFRQVYDTNTREYGGTGLGLTISKSLAELLGGDISVESEIGIGSTFYLNLPFEQVISPAEIKVQNDLHEAYNWTGKIIMVVEDEISNFELVKATLDKTKANIVYAQNGKEAVDLFENSHHFDLILMDIRMPEMNGYDATMKIRETDQEIPIISLTAYAMAEDRQKSLDAGCNDYLSKPIMPKDLLQTIGKYI
jgi:PAS domain S-box-containing protein